ncbi:MULTISPECIES: ferredoxin family protein [Roseiflexus]|jgi:2-oxoglutarate ferredoxin oxidoreductase subunit delta|uniref:4Fe-4S ferredoxin iron-sulfur binding domain protein n=1 Tax=Roseiflexus castenholzii (strain DSM 13941 / HLO8) TaxID=383372 RepID=A7NPY1_ROSCS|nr:MULTISPECIES: ferredoxin family protein [Roseiflexus]ABU59627.1 4Fe-4S ferredoxin iron-sulfur binding domain protein [Roseiflexus castenholzii DSM 13941]GIW02909.1 MAG: hypothetical protein KatS3mg058_4312 [Roseiflexus sp.]
MVRGRIIVDTERCKGCGLCVAFCPKGVVHLAAAFNAAGHHPAQLDDPDGKCTGCTICALVCPEAAITVYRTFSVKASVTAGGVCALEATS